MKKIGIMSMQRVVNYGSFLQAYGLKKTVESLGDYTVEFVDYNYGDAVCESVKGKSLYRKALDNLNIIKFINKKKVEKKFFSDYSKYLELLGVTQQKNYNPDIDTLIIGSDEVFNCVQPYPVGFSKELFGEKYDNANVISYAASFGYTTEELLKKYNIYDEVKRMLNNNFSALSVRDENSYKICSKLVEKNVEMHLDPVLISDFSDEITDNVTLKNYIVVYAYQGRLSRSEEKYIRKFAKKNNKKIVSLGFYQKIADYNLVVSPFEVLEYFQKADYIITDTFHGTIFSIISRNKFATVIRDSNRNKLSFLLKGLKLDSRMVDNITDIDVLYKTPIDYIQTEDIIIEQRELAEEYLQKNL